MMRCPITVVAALELLLLGQVLFILLCQLDNVKCDCCQEFKYHSNSEDSSYDELIVEKTLVNNRELLKGVCDDHGSCDVLQKKRYILYDVNKGEGFNLRRDIFIRIAPLIKALNIKALNNGPGEEQWVLVLPPWRNLPHWGPSRTSFEWSRFFQLDRIQSYIPVMELSQFMEEYGLDNGIDEVFQLQHFPFVKNEEWKEKIQTEVNCEEPFGYKLETEGKISGEFWGQRGLHAKKASCMALRGQASTLVPFLRNLDDKSRAIMFDRAEVILWDNYGDSDWWDARKSLQFSSNLLHLSDLFLEQQGLWTTTNDKIDDKQKFIGIHLRRRDFLYGRSNKFPSILQVSKYLENLSSKLSINVIFIATDTTEDEIKALESHLMGSNLKLLRYPCDDESSGLDLDLEAGECAIIDQILCAKSNHFVGTQDSTFTLRIFEEREILGYSEDKTYNYLCALDNPATAACPQPTRWPIPNK